jgi:hypothetical protein
LSIDELTFTVAAKSAAAQLGDLVLEGVAERADGRKARCSFRYCR